METLPTSPTDEIVPVVADYSAPALEVLGSITELSEAPSMQLGASL